MSQENLSLSESLSEEYICESVRLDTGKAYNNILSLMHQCSQYLDSKYGRVLAGSPSLKDNIMTHYITDSNRNYAKYGCVLVQAFDELQKVINSDKYEINRFLESVR